jgi:hypothetical protein
MCDWPVMIQSCVKRHPYVCLAFLSGVVTTLAANSRPETLRNSLTCFICSDVFEACVNTITSVFKEKLLPDAEHRLICKACVGNPDHQLGLTHVQISSYENIADSFS